MAEGELLGTKPVGSTSGEKRSPRKYGFSTTRPIGSSSDEMTAKGAVWRIRQAMVNDDVMPIETRRRG